MKNQNVNQQQLNGWSMGFLTLLFLTCFSFSRAANINPLSDPGKESIGVFIDSKQMNIDKEGLEITLKGILSLSTLTQVSAKKSIHFRIVIRHRIFAGETLLGIQDERYNDGEEFDRIEVEKILLKAKAWDQIIIIPVDPDSTYENSKTHFLIDVIPDKC